MQCMALVLGLIDCEHNASKEKAGVAPLARIGSGEGGARANHTGLLGTSGAVSPRRLRRREQSNARFRPVVLRTPLVAVGTATGALEL